MNWSYDKNQKVYIREDGLFVAQRENSRRWSLWSKESDESLVRARLVGDYFTSLEHAQDKAAREDGNVPEDHDHT